MNGKKGRRISRREFARRAALASAAVSMTPAMAGASTGLTAEIGHHETAVHPAAAVSASGAGTPAQQPSTPKLSAESQAEAEARLQSILNQYGKRFSDEQKADLRRLCLLAQPPLDRLRAYTLANGDASALYLKPLVEREKNPLEGTRKGKTPAAITSRKKT